ncbi:MAG: hypothetical protein ACE5LC_05310 [Candidatus Aminicenantales bacterium]
MRNKAYLAFIISLILFVNFWLTSCGLEKTEEIKFREKEIEVFLKKAPIVAKKVSPEGGRTAPWKITLDDGRMRRDAHFKYIDRSRPSALADSYKYEIAAYRLNRLLGLDYVPPVVEREIEGMKGSLQVFAEGINENERKRRGLEPPDIEHFQNTIDDIKIFENLVYEEDCLDADDTIIEIKNWKIWRVDFSRAFAPENELLPGCGIERCSKKFFNALQSVDNKTIRKELSSLLNNEEVKALLVRKKLILERIKALIKEKGEEAVLF